MVVVVVIVVILQVQPQEEEAKGIIEQRHLIQGIYLNSSIISRSL